MKAKLVNCTPDPMETAFYAFRNMHNKVGTTVEPFKDIEQKIKFLTVLSKIPHRTVLEFVKTNWYIEGSRAFQQQLTRTRLAGYSIQSLRIVNVGGFADDKLYHLPPGMDDSAEELFQCSMVQAQENYNALIKMGASVEAARGVLPINIETPITMTINLNSLVHLMELRMCKNAQYEYREIANLMYDEVSAFIDPDFARIFFKAPCQKSGYCTSPVPCDMVPKIYQQMITEDVEDIGILG